MQIHAKLFTDKTYSSLLSHCWHNGCGCIRVLRPYSWASWIVNEVFGQQYRKLHANHKQIIVIYIWRKKYNETKKLFRAHHVPPFGLFAESCRHEHCETIYVNRNIPHLHANMRICNKANIFRAKIYSNEWNKIWKSIVSDSVTAQHHHRSVSFDENSRSKYTR